MRIQPLAILLLAAPLLGQSTSPGDRIEAGFRTLSVGSWDDAFKEWKKDSLPLDGTGTEAQSRLEAWIPKTWSIGRWEPILTVPVATGWQRQWWMASFDQGVVILAFDHVLHKGEWRLFRIEASRDPKALLPNLDVLAAQAQRPR
ncbi:MAG TPA: hypothetical protein VF768_01470 [Holophagaceae bacterium]